MNWRTRVPATAQLINTSNGASHKDGRYATLRPVKTNNLQMAPASKRKVRYLLYAFTQQGAITSANVLNSRQTVRSLKSEICDLPSSAPWPADDDKAA